ncbi:MAG TPA: hypothetical protein VG713_15460, partial [Pirellulales bacterium]|nr:hypothetical protein [Pirellulales bacterium]
MHPFVALFYAIAFIGHLALCAAFTNRVHAMAFPRSVIEMFNWIVRAWAIGLTLGLASIGLFAGPGALAISPPYGLPWALVAYLYLAFVAGFVFVPLEWRRRLWFRSPRSLRQQDAELHDFRAHRERRSVGA